MVIEELTWEPFTDFDLRLSSSKIHLFKIDVQECYLKIEGCYKDILSTQELDRASRYFHMKDRRSYLVRRCYLRKILSCFVSFSPQALVFTTTGNKKPALNGVEFSVSHSNNYVVVAVHCSPLGVDVEYLHPNFDFKSMLNSCFHVEERTFISRSISVTGSGIAAGSAAFYALWTRKEALLKATAEGLTDDLKEIGCLVNEVTRMGNLYGLRTFGWDDEYVVSLAVTDMSGEYRYWQV